MSNTGAVGVHWDAHNAKYKVYLGREKKMLHGGYYSDLLEAVFARKAMESPDYQAKPRRNATGVLGVYWDARKQKYTTRLTSKGEAYTMGYYTFKREAAKYRKLLELTILGEVQRKKVCRELCPVAQDERSKQN